MSACLQPPRIDRHGIVYAVAACSVDDERGPFKIGESGYSGETRLSSHVTFEHPDLPLTVVAHHRCFDRVWVESFVHRELAAYRCPAPANWRARGRKPEWFRCSKAVMHAALDKALKADALHRAQAQRSLTLSAQAATLPSGDTWLLRALLDHCPAGRATVRELVAEAFASTRGFSKNAAKLVKLGLRCIPLERLVVLRAQSPELGSLMCRLGLDGWAKHLKTTIGFDDDGRPLSRAELEARCAGYDIEALLA